jgi:hypothetical protein
MRRKKPHSQAAVGFCFFVPRALRAPSLEAERGRVLTGWI